MLLAPALALAGGTCTESRVEYRNSGNLKVILKCTGDTSGVIDNKTLSSETATILAGYYWLVSTLAYPTAGGTAPTDGASVKVNTSHGRDMLGGKGATLIDATDEKAVTPYNSVTDQYVPEQIFEALTVQIGNVGNGGQTTIELNCTK
jgi:hypothetical protein